MLPAYVRRLDRRAGAPLYRSPAPAAVNAGFERLSSGAERGLFWIVLTGLVALTGPRGRRGALRGALTLVVASGTANLVAKSLLRVRRPIARGVRHGLSNVRAPGSPAFPSGHGATAAALAAGVFVESRSRGSVLGVVALLVSYSRLHVGAHELSDVLAGNAYGLLVGLLGAAVHRAPRT